MQGTVVWRVKNIYYKYDDDDNEAHLSDNEHADLLMYLEE